MLMQRNNQAAETFGVAMQMHADADALHREADALQSLVSHRMSMSQTRRTAWG